MRATMLGLLAVVAAGVAWAASAQGAVDYVQFDAQQLVSSPQSAWARPILFTDELASPVGSPEKKLDRKRYAELRLKTAGSVWVPESDVESFQSLEVGKTYSFGGTVDQFRGKYYVIVDTSFPIQTKEALEDQWSGMMEGGTAGADDPVVQNLLVTAQNRLIRMAQEQGVTVEQLVEAQTDGGQRIAETIVAESLQSQLRESNQTAEQVMIDAVVALLQKEAALKGTIPADENLPQVEDYEGGEGDDDLVVDVPDEDDVADENWWANLEDAIAGMPDSAPDAPQDVPELPDIDLPADEPDQDVAEGDLPDDNWEENVDVVADVDVSDSSDGDMDLPDLDLPTEDEFAGDMDMGNVEEIPDDSWQAGDEVASSVEESGTEESETVAMPIPGLVQPMDGSSRLTPMVLANPTAAELEESARLQRQLAKEQEEEAERLEKEAKEEAKRQEKARKEAEKEAKRLEKEARRAEEEAREREEEARIAAEKEAARKLKQAKKEAEEKEKALKAALEAQQAAAVEAARQGERLAAAKAELERQRKENEEAMRALAKRRKAAEAAKAAAERETSTVQEDVARELEAQLAALEAEKATQEAELNEQLRQAYEIAQEEQARGAKVSEELEAEKSAAAAAQAKLEKARQATADAERAAAKADTEAARAKEQAKKDLAKAKANAEEAARLKAKADADAEKAKAKAEAEAAKARAKAQAEAEKTRQAEAAKKAAEDKKAAEAKKAAAEKKASGGSGDLYAPVMW